MIQIKAGTFGYYNGRKVIPITSADGPQKFDSELEARLVEEGVAEYIDEAPTAQPADPDTGDPAGTPAPQDPEHNDNEPEGAAEAPADELPAYHEDMKLDELKEIAKAYGVDASAMRKKADVIEAIEAKEQEPDADDEDPPQPGAADPV